MKRKNPRSERVSSITCLESLIEAAQQREWQKAQERKSGVHSRIPTIKAARREIPSERHPVLN